ncbi:MAG: carbon-nitrogen hydrolase family protein [Hyphomicrobiaceae bacterium]
MTPPNKLTIATAQYPIDELKTNFDWQDKIERWVVEAKATGAELLVFPEYGAIEQAAAFGGETSRDLKKTLSAVASVAGERVAFQSSLAAEHNVHILIGSGPFEVADGRVTNSAQLVTPAGHVGTATKSMMTPFERDWGVVAGEPLCVFDTAIGRIGVAICYDSEFPLLVRALVAAGADMILVPSCTERISGSYRIAIAAMARALENTCAVVVSQTVGDALWSPAVDVNCGRSGIYVPAEHGVSDTGALVKGEWNKPEWVVGEVDFARLRLLKDSGEMRNASDWDRQPGTQLTLPEVEVVDLR